ncbi:hypothetical protein B0T17DRAFT_642138 [Bombardia bombarda]|uniref:Uncharacterized protein n=1 Tax=Bombardia bombarda TaxID=252184 RepID=A0AA39WUH5_9PEZI|nr:hypothetical protein B0T17DRAFT_642138 [Bombardia bombarda]
MANPCSACQVRAGLLVASLARSLTAVFPRKIEWRAAAGDDHSFWACLDATLAWDWWLVRVQSMPVGMRREERARCCISISKPMTDCIRVAKCADNVSSIGQWVFGGDDSDGGGQTEAAREGGIPWWLGSRKQAIDTMQAIHGWQGFRENDLNRARRDGSGPRNSSLPLISNGFRVTHNLLSPLILSLIAWTLCRSLDIIHHRPRPRRHSPPSGPPSGATRYHKNTITTATTIRKEKGKRPCDDGRDLTTFHHCSRPLSLHSSTFETTTTTQIRHGQPKQAKMGCLSLFYFWRRKNPSSSSPNDEFAPRPHHNSVISTTSGFSAYSDAEKPLLRRSFLSTRNAAAVPNNIDRIASIQPQVNPRFSAYAGPAQVSDIPQLDRGRSLRRKDSDSTWAESPTSTQVSDESTVFGDKVDEKDEKDVDGDNNNDDDDETARKKKEEKEELERLDFLQLM